MPGEMALPVDIPWKRLAASSDMMDERHGDRKFPPKWRSSISIFYHEPDDVPEVYCERAITYLKIVCSVTGYQVGQEVSAGAETPNDALKQVERELGEAYYPCYGALLQVAVFPKSENLDGEFIKRLPFSEYPYIADFEPKRRELYEAVSRSGEILDRSSSTLNVRKSATTGQNTDYSSRIGAEVKATYAAVQGTVSGEHKWGGGTHVEQQNINTTDESREKRETYSATTNLTQMYELFTGYHLGTNRAVFFLKARPHTVEEKDQYTFINGPRRLEGIQEIFLIVNRPKDQPGLCVEAFLETAHLMAETAEPQAGPGAPTPQVTYTTGEVRQTFSGRWEEERGSVGNTKDYELTVQLPAGAELDTSRPNPPQEFPVESYGPMPRLTIYVPAGVFLDIDDALWRSFARVTASAAGGNVILTVTLRNGPVDVPRFSMTVHVYYRVAHRSEAPAGGSPAKPRKSLFLTSRGLSACIALADGEGARNGMERRRAGSVYSPVDWQKMLAEPNRAKLLEWLDQQQVLNFEGMRPSEYREKLRDLTENDPPRLEKELREAFDRGDFDRVPAEWTLPTEWIAFEDEIPLNPRLDNPEAPALERIRAANELTNRIGDRIIESLGSSQRYPDRSVDFWHTRAAFLRLENAIAALPDQHPDNGRVQDLAIPNREALLNAFGAETRRNQLARIDIATLQAELAISESEARQVKLDLLRASRRRDFAPEQREE